MQPRRAGNRTTSHQGILDYYARPGAMTVTQHHDLIAALPGDVAKLARIVQGLAIHQYMAPAYGFKVPEARLGEAHIRHVGVMLRLYLGGLGAMPSADAYARRAWQLRTGRLTPAAFDAVLARARSHMEGRS